ncbi:MAG: radical SAM protein [Elusimicrobiota bacterium]
MQSKIKKIKIAVTSRCNLRCLHCNVEKDLAINISHSDIKKALLLIKKYKEKKIKIEFYGGEPFLNFEVLKKSVNTIRKIKGYENSAIFIASNGTIINKKILDFIEKNNIYLAISFSGSLKSHNLNRVYLDGTGSYKIVKQNIIKAIKRLKDKIIAIYCVSPDFVENMIEDFKKIVLLGFKIINIECVSGSGKWNEERYNIFEKNMKKINEYILKSIKKRNYIYHESFFSYLDKERVEEFCPFYSDIELYPDGKFGFYPYSFIKYSKDRDKVVIGDVKNGFYKKYETCKYNRRKCESCIKNYYYKEELKDGGIALNIRDRLIKDFFSKIMKKNKEPLFRDYIKNAVRFEREIYGM